MQRNLNDWKRHSSVCRTSAIALNLFYYCYNYGVNVYDVMKILNVEPAIRAYIADFDPDLVWAPPTVHRPAGDTGSNSFATRTTHKLPNVALPAFG